MTSLENMRRLIAQCQKEDELREKETQKHFENQQNKYKEMFEGIKHIQGQTEKCIDGITKGLDYLVSNKHTIVKALQQTDNLDGLPIPPEQQENAIDLINKMAKFMNNIELISSPNPVSPEQIQKDVASYTANVAEELKDCKTDLHAVKALSNKTQLLQFLTTSKPQERQTSPSSAGLASKSFAIEGLQDEQNQEIDKNKTSQDITKSEKKLYTITECE